MGITMIRTIILFLLSNILVAQSFEWSRIAPMQTARWLHSAVELANGEILVTGGDGFYEGKNNICEIYNPQTDTWRNTDTMTVKRWEHASILLDDGRVLVIGGEDELSCEIFNPITEKWTLTDSLLLKRQDEPRITKLQNGNILITGGSRRTGVGKEEIYNSCEAFDVKNEEWYKIADMNYSRKSHTVATLKDGRVLVTGGIGKRDTLDTVTEICEIYNPAINKWVLGDTIKIAHYNHSALLLNNGNVFISAGEIKGDSYYTEICELYDPIIDKWSIAGGLAQYHPRNSSFQISDSTILMVGGDNPNWEIFNLNQLQSTFVGISEIEWFSQSVVELSNGKIVKIGGMIWIDATVYPTNQCEIYDPNITSIKNHVFPNIDVYQLFQNYPNPFNPSTTISYALPYSSNVQLTIYDITGKVVKVFNKNGQSAGYQNIVWHGNSQQGSRVSSGVYFYRFKATSLESNGKVFEKTAKLLLLK
jgi:N-acetylneuraminic acid mutarotase